MPGSADEGTALLEADAGVGVGATAALGQSKVNGAEETGVVVDAQEEVIWLDVAVDVALLVDVLDQGNGGVGDHEDGFEGEAAVAEEEEVLEVAAEDVSDHEVELGEVDVVAGPVREGNAELALVDVVESTKILDSPFSFSSFLFSSIFMAQ